LRFSGAWPQAASSRYNLNRERLAVESRQNTMHIFAFLLAASVLAMVGLIGYVYWRIRHHLHGTPRPELKPAQENTAAVPPPRSS
jgi:hypothetical protein